MPMLVDHDRRRTELVEAVWRVVRRDGVRGASVREVAKEAGLSTGSVRYFFGTQDELLRFAMRELADRVRARADAGVDERLDLVAAGEPAEAVVRLLRQVLPINPEQLAEVQVWFAFVLRESADPVVRGIRQEMDAEVHQLCRHCVLSLAEAGAIGHGRDPEHEATLLWALIDGLTLRTYLDPETTRADTILDTVRSHLRQLAVKAA